MTSSDVLSSLEIALGGICPIPKLHSTCRLLDVSVDANVFDKLLRYWIGLPEVSRPRLRGLTVSRSKVANLHLLLEISGRSPFVLVTVDPSWNKDTISKVWPYAVWWEKELSSFGKNHSTENVENPGVMWRRG